jgi:DNA-directed RNA polymerase specialized sigma24 family protein
MNADLGSERAADDARRAARLPDLLRAAAQGDQEAWAQLLGEQLRRKVYTAVRWRLSDPDVLEDAWQEAALIAHRHVHADSDADASARGRLQRFIDGDFDGWFFRVFSRQAFRMDGKSAKRRGASVELDEDLDAGAASDGSQSPEQAAISERHLQYLVERAQRMMSEPQWQTLQTHLETELLGEDLAREVGRRLNRKISKGAAAVNLTRAHQKIKARADAVLLVVRGRNRCPELDRILGDRELALPLPDATADRVDKHHKKCERCKDFVAGCDLTRADHSLLMDSIASRSAILPLPPPVPPLGTPAVHAVARKVAKAVGTVKRHKQLSVAVSISLTVSLSIVLPLYLMGPNPKNSGAADGPSGSPSVHATSDIPAGQSGPPPSDGSDPLPGGTGATAIGSPTGGAPPPSGGSGAPVPSPPASPTAPPPPPVQALPQWGFVQDSPAGTYDSDWTYGLWRLGNPNPIPTPRKTRLGTGRQQVVLPGVGAPGGVALVTAYDSQRTGLNCQPVGWQQQGADESIDVACFDRAGAPADATFDALFLAGTTDNGYSIGELRGFVYASKPTTAAYTPSAPDERNAGQITRADTGRYSVQIPSGAEAVQVSPVSAADRSCTVTGPVTGATVSVTCTAHGGAPLDTAFVLSYTGRQSLLDDARKPQAAFLSVTDGSSSGEPSQTDWWLSKSGTPTVERNATGQYTLTMPIGEEPSYTHLTTYGSGYCTLVLRNDYSHVDNSTFYVQCFTASGTAANGSFELTYMSGIEAP